MLNLGNYELIGLVATLFVLISFTRNKTFQIRVINTVGSVLFVVYGWLIHSPSVYILNFCCIIVNLYRLYLDRGYFNVNKHKRGGAIVLGYPGVGKTTIAQRHEDCIDLESSDFNLLDSDENVDRYWKTARRLENQGYIVFVSTHESVQRRAKKALDVGLDTVKVVYPDMNLRKHWISKVRFRKEVQPSTSNISAWKHLNLHYLTDIRGLMCRFPKDVTICISNTDYDMEWIYRRIKNNI